MFIIILLFTTVTYATTSVTILNQTNEYKGFLFDFSNRLICHRYTDWYLFPLLYATDDFVIPSYTSLNAIECTSIVFTFNTIRTKQDMDPYNITIRLFYHNT